VQDINPIGELFCHEYSGVVNLDKWRTNNNYNEDSFAMQDNGWVLGMIL